MPATAVLDSHTAYTETRPADAPAIGYVHGNPTSSFLCRNVAPNVPDIRSAGPAEHPEGEAR
jgi:hypothetical protein